MYFVQRFFILSCIFLIPLTANDANERMLDQMPRYGFLSHHTNIAAVEVDGTQSALPIMEGCMAQAYTKLNALAQSFAVRHSLELIIDDHCTEDSDIMITPKGATIVITAAVIKQGGAIMEEYLKKMITALCAYDLYSATTIS